MTQKNQEKNNENFTYLVRVKLDEPSKYSKDVPPVPLITAWVHPELYLGERPVARLGKKGFCGGAPENFYNEVEWYIRKNHLDVKFFPGVELKTKIKVEMSDRGAKSKDNSSLIKQVKEGLELRLNKK